MDEPKSITLVRGARGAERVRSLGARHSGLRVTWAGVPEVPTPWAGARAIVRGARDVLGDEVVDRALGPEASVLALAMPELGVPDAALAAEHGGLAQRGRPNVVARGQHLISSLCRALATALAGRPLTLLVPTIEHADLESLHALRPLMAALERVRVVIGYDDREVSLRGLDQMVRALRLEELKRLAALSITRVEEHAHEDDCPAPLGSSPERRWLLALGAYGAGGEGRVLDAMRTAMEALSFETALRLARALVSLTRDPVRLREAHLTAAIACQNLHPLTSRPGWARDAMDTHLAGALDGETDALVRSHLRYRQTILVARAHSDPARAIAHGREAVALARSVSERPESAYVEAWAHNGLGYALSRAGQLADAATACESGVSCLGREGLERAVCAVDVELSRALLSNNRARVAQPSGDRAALASWRAATEASFARLPAHEQPGPLWLTPPDDERDLAATLRHHTRVLARSRATFDPDSEAVAAHFAGLASFRLGDATSARALFATSLRIWRALGSHAEDIATEELNCAVTAFRAGDLEAAERGFQALLASPLFAAESARAELLAALSMVAAACGDVALCRERALIAFERASASGELDSLVRVLRSLGEAELLLGEPGRALAALRRAHALVERVGAAPEDELGVLVALLDAGADEDGLVERASMIAEDALRDANAWWDLPRLARHATRLGVASRHDVRSLVITAHAIS